MINHLDHTSETHDHLDDLLIELESQDDPILSLALRASFSDNENQKLIDKLEARIKQYDREIRSLCNHHHQEFVQAIQDLLEVRPKVENLKKQLLEINHDVQKSSENVQRKAEELIRHRKIVGNIETAIECLSVCLPVLKMYAKLMSQMATTRYYPALKTLELLESSYLPRLSHYRFAQTMRDNIPKIRDQIKEASMSDLKDFLDNIRKLSSKVGELAMKSAALRQNITFEDSRLEENESEEELSATDVVDFSPVYRCVHIFGCLGASEVFENYYRLQREQQVKLVLLPPVNMHENIAGYREYFCGIVGFFVIENHVLNTAPGLINKNYLNEAWENALQSVISSIRTYSSYCTDDKLMLKIKHIIILFTQTLQSYGYNVNLLSSLLIELRDQYNEILMKSWCKIFRDIFDADNYHPHQVESPHEYFEIINEFPFYESEVISIGDGEYPKKFPFSMFVPKIFTQVKRFIDACRQFSQDLNLSQTEIEDMVRKSTNYLLTRTLSGCLSGLIKKPNLGLLQLIQIAINTNYLEDSMSYLEEYITKSAMTGINMPLGSAENLHELGGSHLAKLQGSSMFKDARSDAESQIYFLLNQKIDEFFEIAHYDWMLFESYGVASAYICDLVKFLTCTFQAFTNLPLKVAQTACLSACKHMASSLKKFLLDEDVKAISMGALEQFNLDLLHCEFFASSEPVRGFEDNALSMCFSELRQLVDLSLSWQWSAYIIDYGKQTNKYLRVNPQIALNILEKIKEAEKNRNLFSSLKKNERDKRKLVETVIKQLKQLIATQQ
ncbi:exocyst complex component Sec15 [Brevipalpus obovatus]|uniref:exocyst complex component Sec15 n=1 Tax=Brevipalpus obovatus TaxID=246614 RepID=UPI003D9F567F